MDVCRQNARLFAGAQHNGTGTITMMEALRILIATSNDAAELESATQALAKDTEPFAALRMNRGIRQALAGKNVQTL